MCLKPRHGDPANAGLCPPKADWAGPKWDWFSGHVSTTARGIHSKVEPGVKHRLKRIKEIIYQYRGAPQPFQ